MTARKHSPTSKAAWDSVKDHLGEIHQKIIDAFEKLPAGGNSYELASAAGLEKEQVHKRLNDLVGMQKIFNTGITRLSPKGKQCSVYQLRKTPPPTIKGELIQPELF